MDGMMMGDINMAYINGDMLVNHGKSVQGAGLNGV